MAFFQFSLVLMNCTMWSCYFFLHPAVSHVFHGSGFSTSRFFGVQVFLGSRSFRVQIFQGPCFSWSRFFWVCVYGPGLGSGSRFQKQPINRSITFHDVDLLILDRSNQPEVYSVRNRDIVNPPMKKSYLATVQRKPYYFLEK